MTRPVVTHVGRLGTARIAVNNSGNPTELDRDGILYLIGVDIRHARVLDGCYSEPVRHDFLGGYSLEPSTLTGACIIVHDGEVHYLADGMSWTPEHGVRQ